MKRQIYPLAVVALVGVGVTAWQSVHVDGQAPPAAASRPVQHYDDAVLSKPTYEVRTEVDVKIPMRDGVPLSADIYRPDAEGKFPAILVRTPYSNGTDPTIATSKWWAERGYVLIQQDVRGKYDSKGDFYPFKNEPNDGYDMDEWIGKQTWFNGKLGTMGGSYVGFTQWSQAIRQSKYLVAMAPQVTTPDIYGNWLYIDGALNYAFDVSWGSVSIDGQIAQATNGIVDMMKVYRTLPMIDAPKTAGHKAPHYRDWVSHPVRSDPYWNDISRETEIDKVEVPMLTVEGWYDIFLRGAINDDITIRAKGKTDVARAGKRLMIGPWIHGGGRRNNVAAGVAADPNATDFGPAAEVDIQKMYLRWFDFWLKGVENGVKTEPPVKIFVMGENVWRYENEWPLKRAVATNYYITGGRANSLNGNGRLATAMPTGPETDTYTYDPNDPVPTLGGNSCCAALTPTGPWDQRAAERRDDVLVFSTPVLTQAVEVTGPVTMKLFAASSATDTDWTAKLVDVGPDGFARNVQEGILRARYRETRGQRPGSPIEANKVYEYTIDMWAGSNLFLPGHQIRLEVSSSNFPRFDRNLNSGLENNALAPASSAKKAAQTIYHNAQYPSHVVLPIVPRGTQPVSTTTSR